MCPLLGRGAPDPGYHANGPVFHYRPARPFSRIESERFYKHKQAHRRYDGNSGLEATQKGMVGTDSPTRLLPRLTRPAAQSGRPSTMVGLGLSCVLRRASHLRAIPRDLQAAKRDRAHTGVNERRAQDALVELGELLV